jgi:hypothetical protein
MGMGNVRDIQMIGVRSEEIRDGKLFRQTSEDTSEATLHVDDPLRRDGAKLGKEILIPLDGPSDHRWKEQNECHVLANAARFGFVAIPIPGVMQEFESEERNSKGQKRASPIERILLRHRPDQTREKIAVFEHDKKQNCLHDAKPAKPGRRLVETADEGFPKKNQEARSSNGAA